MADSKVEKLAKLMEKFLKPLVEKLGFDMDSVESVEVDPEGPRIIIQCRESQDYKRFFIDLSPDGVEVDLTLPAPRGLDPGEVEDLVGLRIEEGEEFVGIEEYDVGYDPEEGEVTVVLHAKTVNAIPAVQNIRRIVLEILEEIAARKAGEQ